LLRRAREKVTTRMKTIMRAPNATCLLQVLFCLLAALASTLAGVEAGGAPHSLHAGPYLLLDDFLVETSSNVTRTINAPKRDPAAPVVTAKEDQNFQPYVTVLRDSQLQKFRVWYGVPINAGQSHLAYMESLDGIHWIRPHRVLEDPARITFGASVL